MLDTTRPDPFDFRRLQPLDDAFGGGRGKPVDRHYIEAFLETHAPDIRGRVLEVGGDDYTRRFGRSRVVWRDVLHVEPGHPATTLVGDLSRPGTLPYERYDCFICTQTLTYVYPLEQAVASIHRLLRPGGVLLATVPGISQISPFDREHFGEYWRFTPQALERLFADRFGAANVQARSHGNVLAATAFLQGLACEDLSPEELAFEDDRYPLVVAARVVKPPASRGRP